jgi:hypothetical protein
VTLPAVSFAVIQDMAASWEQYEAIARPLEEPVSLDLVLRVAGRTDEGVRIIDVWESEDAWQLFRTERLLPALAARAQLVRPELVVRELHAQHVVVGNPSRLVSLRTQAWKEEE